MICLHPDSGYFKYSSFLLYPPAESHANGYNEYRDILYMHNIFARLAQGFFFNIPFLQGKCYTVIGMEMKYDKDYVYMKIIRALKKYKFLKMYYEVKCSIMVVLYWKYNNKPKTGNNESASGLRF